MIFRFNIFIKSLLLFAATMGLGIFSSYRYGHIFRDAPIPQAQFRLTDLVWLVVFFLFFTFVMTRYQKVARISFRVFLFLVIFSGAQLIFGSLVSPPLDLILSLAVLAIMVLVRSVITHDLGVILGIAGVSSILGFSLAPQVVVIMLIILSFYDIIAVYKTGHMVKLAQGMIQSGAVFGFLIPINWNGFFIHRAKAVVGQDIMILGSGDIGLPIVLASSLVKVSLVSALCVAIGSAVGLLVTHLIFVNQKERRAMAALPPIATAAILGYLVGALLIT